MSLLVCLGANTLYYPDGGGHRWAYLNWALGLVAAGCRVIWLEWVAPERPVGLALTGLAALERDLEPAGLATAVALCGPPGRPLPPPLAERTLDLAAAAEADVLLNFRYGTPAAVVRRFRRSVLVDIDPGLLQRWIARGEVEVPSHAAYVTIGEGVASRDEPPRPGAVWLHVPPCVALDWWGPSAPAPDAAVTAVSHWYAKEWMTEGEEVYRNDKRSGFLPFADLAARAPVPLELALCLGDGDREEREALERRGWRVRDAAAVAGTADGYRAYVRASLGEFGWAKPAYVRLGDAWLSDRTVCYLASGKPAVVQYTGPSRFLPDGDGLFRYRTLEEAAAALERIAADYPVQSRRARALAEAHFDARRVVTRLLARVV